MALRLHEQVVRGLIDNRNRDHTVGRIWFIDRKEPVELSLRGNAWRDLAGRRLEFVNPAPLAGHTSALSAIQNGVIGDCTASRRVKVPEVSMAELVELYAARKPFPWHWGNSLYLEWYSEANGRVVIESASYHLTVTDTPGWEMSEEEERDQRIANAQALEGFMNQLVDAVDEAASPGAEPTWQPERPMSEAEAEAIQAASDKLADRIEARIEREGPDADYEKILEEELERRARERGDPPLTPEQEAADAIWIEEMNRAAEEALNDPFEPEERQRHPLVERASELSLRVHHYLKDTKAIPENANREHPVIELLNATMCVGPKLAGALHGESWPPDLLFCAGVLVRLKSARGFLEDADLAAQTCAEEKLLDGQWIAGVSTEIVALAKTCDEMIAYLRQRLESAGA